MRQREWKARPSLPSDTKQSFLVAEIEYNADCIKAQDMQFVQKGPFPPGCFLDTSLHKKSDVFEIKINNQSNHDFTISANTCLGTVTAHKINDSTSVPKINLSYGPSSPETSREKRVDDVATKLKLGERLTALEKDALLTFLAKNNDVFQWEDCPPGRTHLVTHSIPTGDARPIVQRQYPIPTIAQEHLRAQVIDMMKKDIIRESNGSWRSPVLLIKKIDENGVVQYRFCIDLRKVNEVTVKDAYSLPRIDESADALAGSKFFSTMDINRAFWQVPLAEEDKKKTGFMVEGRLYEFNVMPFGSMNAPVTFQRLMDRVLSGLTWKQVLVYLADILVFAKSFLQHCESLIEVFSRLRRANLKLKPSKCVFGTHKVNYLGFTISDEGIKPSFAKVQALLKTERPQTTKVLLSFLCTVNYYRNDIPCYGELTADLYDMANEKRRFCVWKDKTINDFNTLR